MSALKNQYYSVNAKDCARDITIECVTESASFLSIYAILTALNFFLAGCNDVESL